MFDLLKRLVNDFKDKTIRDVYCDEFLNATIATQIKVLREQRGLTQTQLAELSGMKQSRIATMEDINYFSWTISTLRKLAKAFDVTLSVRFESFGEKLIEIDSFSREHLERPSFNEDRIVQEIEHGETAMTIEAQSISVATVTNNYSAAITTDVESAFPNVSKPIGTSADQINEMNCLSNAA